MFDLEVARRESEGEAGRAYRAAAGAYQRAQDEALALFGPFAEAIEQAMAARSALDVAYDRLSRLGVGPGARPERASVRRSRDVVLSAPRRKSRHALKE